jgi:integrase
MAKREWKGVVVPGIRRVTIKGKEVFRVQIGRRGKGNRKSKICHSIEEAVKTKTDWLTHGLPAKGAEKTPLADETPSTVGDGLAQYEMVLLSRGKPIESARRSSRQVLRAIEMAYPEFARLPLHAVTVDDVREFVKRRRTTSADSTVGRDFNGLRAMLKLTRPDLKIPSEVKPPDDLTRVRMLTDEQRAAIFPEIDERYGPTLARIARLALLTTLRLTEVATLRREMVHLPLRVIRQTVKGGRPELVRLNAEAVEVVRQQLESHGSEWVFPNPRTDQPYSRVHISRAWRRSCEAVGITDFRFHDIRHHLPTVAATNGASNRQLMAILRLKSAKMVDRYAHVLDPAIDEIMGMVSQHESPSPDRPSRRLSSLRLIGATASRSSR